MPTHSDPRTDAATGARGVAPLEPRLYDEIVDRALDEDLGRGGDITTRAVLPAETAASGRVVARAAGVLAGLDVALAVFRRLDPDLEATVYRHDGDRLAVGDAIVDLATTAAALLAGERTALNFLTHLSGVATATRQMVDRVEGTGARITCTRKTTPGLRVLEKYAVRVGGGHNHRFGLDDAVLIKDNHVALAGGVAEAVERARRSVGHLIRVEVEVETLAELDAAMAAGADAVLLDNMPPDLLRRAVERAGGRVVLEASGGVDAGTVGAIAASGVDLVSVGRLTHSAPGLDLALEILTPGRS